jgi:hypothetical protein
VWVLAKLRFRFKPKARIWNQDGLQELVTITAPKKVEVQLTDNLSQTEVKSRLKALADTIDSRGWAIKNAQVNIAMTEQTSDRLVSPTILPQQVPTIDSGVTDVLDDQAPISSSFDHMIETSDREHMENSLEQMERARRGEPIGDEQPEIRFSTPTSSPMPVSMLPTPTPVVVSPMPHVEEPEDATPSLIQPIDTTADEDTLAQQLKERHEKSIDLYGHNVVDNDGHPIIRKHIPAGKSAEKTKAQPEMTTSATPAIIQKLSEDNNLYIDTVGRVADEATKADENDGEVVINLH